jgi:ornithine cyclodeaminase/alanine dehydrogenase-like protein (mu-crystallin family)
MSQPAWINAEEFKRLTPWPRLIEALKQAFGMPCQMPDRVQFDVSGQGTLLLMPAWQDQGSLGVKIVQVFPGNTTLGKPAVNGMYMLCSALTGELQAIFDADELTTRRTAATSALASSYLSRPNSQCLLLMGAGRLALNVAAAHASVRPIQKVLIWARQSSKAQAAATHLTQVLGIKTEGVESLPAALAEADIVSTITTTEQPILPGLLVRPGTHVDLIGGFTPAMREADDELLLKCTLYVDMRASAFREAGDIVEPIARGVIDESDVRADLFDLCVGPANRRIHDEEITVFKSVGLALEDLTAAGLAFASLTEKGS